MNKTLIVFAMITIFISVIIFVRTTDFTNQTEETKEDITTKEYEYRQVSNTSICKDLNMREYNNTHCYTNTPSSS